MPPYGNKLTSLIGNIEQTLMWSNLQWHYQQHGMLNYILWHEFSHGTHPWHVLLLWMQRYEDFGWEFMEISNRWLIELSFFRTKSSNPICILIDCRWNWLDLELALVLSVLKKLLKQFFKSGEVSNHSSLLCRFGNRSVSQRSHTNYATMHS
jgi:hypothetical protein